jgi:hypothetical protein
VPHIGHNFNFGLTTNEKAKKKEQTMKLTQDSNTFPQVWHIESQHSQVAFPLWEFKSCGILNFWHKNSSRKNSLDWVFNIPMIFFEA